MERIDEMEGEGNAYDFGARIYDPRLGRWLSRDPKEAKYPNLSPYVFCANNPIVYNDYNGKDFGVEVDHTSTHRTITIVANFYTINDKSTKEAEAAIAQWNSLDGSKVEIDGKVFTVHMQLKVNPHLKDDDQNNDQSLSYDNAQELSKNDIYGNTYNSSTNGLSKLPNDKKHKLGEDYRLGSITDISDVGYSDGKNITMPIVNQNGALLYAPRDILNSVEHELGHNLGLNHVGNGAMKESSPDKPNINDVVNIINNAFSQKTGNAKCKTSSTVNSNSEDDYDPNLFKKTVVPHAQ